MKKRKVRCKLKCILRKCTPKSCRLYGLVTHCKLSYVTYLHKCECFFSNFLKLKSATASKPLQNNKRITSSCLNNHRITNNQQYQKTLCLKNKAFGIFWYRAKQNPGPEHNLNSRTILSFGSTMLLNVQLRQLWLRTVDVGDEGDCFFSEQFLISYIVIPIITYSLDRLVFNTLAITLNVLLKAILRIHGMNIY